MTMKLRDLCVYSKGVVPDGRTFSRQGDVVAERYLLQALARKCDTGQFRKIVVWFVNAPNEVKADFGALGVLEMYVAFNFLAFSNLEHGEQQRRLLRLLHDRLLIAAAIYGFDIPTLDDAFRAASAMDDSFVFPTKFRATLATPYRLAELVFRCDGIGLQLGARVKVARGASTQFIPLRELAGEVPSGIGYIVEDFYWLDDSRLGLRFTPTTKSPDVVISITSYVDISEK
jgi:hypothetical protein